MTDADSQISILLVDDHALVRAGVREILKTQADMTVVGEAEDSTTTIAVAEARQPDVILLDVEIPGSDVTSTVSELRKRSPGSRILVLSMHEGPQLVQTLLAAGVRGYLLKSSRWEELVAAIRAVRTDPDRIVLGVSRQSLSYVTCERTASALSARERKVLELVALALSNGQIATHLDLTEATVKRHLRNIFAKLGAVSRLDAVNKAKVRHGPPLAAS